MDDAYAAGGYVAELTALLPGWEQTDAAGPPGHRGRVSELRPGRPGGVTERPQPAARRICMTMWVLRRESVLDVVPRVDQVDAGIALIL